MAKSQLALLVADVFSNTSVAENKVHFLFWVNEALKDTVSLHAYDLDTRRIRASKSSVSLEILPAPKNYLVPRDSWFLMTILSCS